MVLRMFILLLLAATAQAQYVLCTLSNAPATEQYRVINFADRDYLRNPDLRDWRGYNHNRERVCPTRPEPISFPSVCDTRSFQIVAYTSSWASATNALALMDQMARPRTAEQAIRGAAKGKNKHDSLTNDMAIIAAANNWGQGVTALTNYLTNLQLQIEADREARKLALPED